MKKYCLLIICLILTVCFFSCNSTKKTNNQKSVTTENISTETENNSGIEYGQEKLVITGLNTLSSAMNYSSLTNEDVGKTLSIEGQIVKTDSSWTLITNPTSKSKVNFILENANDFSKELSESEESYVIVDCVLVNADKTWTKSINIKAITSIK